MVLTAFYDRRTQSLVPRALNPCYPTGTEGASNVKATSMGIDVKDLSCKV